MTDLLAFLSVVCFQSAAWPAMLYVIRRGSSDGLSIWRELLLLAGVGCQLAVMWRTDAAWQVIASPVISALNVGALLWVMRRYRRR